MARPVKERKVHHLPDWQCYGPMLAEDAKADEMMVLSAEEYETIRLIDLAGYSQATCAESMEVARTTVQAIYSEARRKLAAALVYGRPLQVSGGTYQLCEQSPAQQEHSHWGCPRWARRSQTERMEGPMKIAVTYENGQIFQHFGKSEAFKMYTVENNAVTQSEVVSTNGQGHGALGDFLMGQDVDAVICGGIGPGAQDVLRSAGIGLYAGVTGNCDDAVEKLLAGTLVSQEGATCDHHDHGHGHGHHGEGCGHHGHGHGGCHH